MAPTPGLQPITALPVTALSAGVPPAAAGGVPAVVNSAASTFTPQGSAADQTLSVGAISGATSGVASGRAETNPLEVPATGVRSAVVLGNAPAPVTAPATAGTSSTTTATAAASAVLPTNVAAAGSAAGFPAAALAEGGSSGAARPGDTTAPAPTAPAPAAPADALAAAGTAVAAVAPAEPADVVNRCRAATRGPRGSPAGRHAPAAAGEAALHPRRSPAGSAHHDAAGDPRGPGPHDGQGAHRCRRRPDRTLRPGRRRTRGHPRGPAGAPQGTRRCRLRCQPRRLRAHRAGQHSPGRNQPGQRQPGDRRPGGSPAPGPATATARAIRAPATAGMPWPTATPCATQES